MNCHAAGNQSDDPPVSPPTPMEVGDTQHSDNEEFAEVPSNNVEEPPEEGESPSPARKRRHTFLTTY